jgi:hypothetical protein
MWNKSRIGTDRTKISNLTPAELTFLATCEYCGTPEQTEDHLIRRCFAKTFTAIRPNFTPVSPKPLATILLAQCHSTSLLVLSAYLPCTT